MTSLKFNGDITLDEIFSQHKLVIYDKIVESIFQNYKNKKIDEITVISIAINDFEYSVTLTREKFVTCLENAIIAYEKIEEYEKCKRCLDVINELIIKEKKYV
jgi:hypothetical protein